MLARIFVVALALLGFVGVAHAGDKVLYQAAPDWVTPAPPIDGTKLNGSSPMFILFDQQQRMSTDGQVWGYANLATRMSSPQMLTAAGTITLPWSPEKGDLIIHTVEIIRGTEHIDLIKAGQRFNVLQREQMLERAMLNGLLTATLPVEGLRVGDVLHISFSITQKDPVLGGNFQTVMPLLPEQIRVNYGRVRLLWPKAMDLHWRTYVKDPVTQTGDTGDYRELTLTMPLPKQPEVPGDAPMRFQRPSIIEATDFGSWGAVAARMTPLFSSEGKIAPGSPLAAEVAKIAKATPDPRLRTAMALRLVQDEIRYLFRGMDDGNYVPQTPAQTWELRFGDCKAKTMLLVAMLRALGIEADAALTSMSAGDLLPQRLPMPGAFDHVITRAVIGGDVLWLDGTANDARLADLNDVPPFRYALPLRAGVTDLVALPMRANARPDADVTVEIDQRAGIGFTAPFTVTAKMRGGMTSMVRMATASMESEQANSMIDILVMPYVFGGTVVDRKMSYDEESGVTTITASGYVDMSWTKDGEHYKVGLDTVLDGFNFTPDRARAAWKDIPVTTGEFANKRVRVVLRLPDGGRGFTLEGDQTLPPVLAGMQLARSTAMADGVITIEDRAVTGVAEIVPADIPAARQQVTRAKARILRASAPIDSPPNWQTVEALRRAKAFDPVLAMFAKRIANKPDDAETYTARAVFNMTIYDRKAALPDIDKAIEIAPSAELYLQRSILRSALGNDAGAIDDARAALDLDPGLGRGVTQLTDLLAENGGLEEALAMVSERVENGGKEKNFYLIQQALLLSRGGRVPEGLALLDAALTTDPRDPWLLNNRCWIKATMKIDLEGALKDCTLGIELADNPANIVDSRAMVYYRMGRIDEALAELDAALKQDPNQAASLFMRGVIRRERGDKRGDADLAAARLISPRIDREYAHYGIKP
ncbi:DUF3857 domain-containing protein [Sphingomonas sp. LB-2]|uniref:DUF3857 domain-containing protein n=1 Tax=Sphingomonas caeni TaxID=2984949 RepID=UPI0022327DAE|nr:DUF3857 domain-containing protein [Sphingomonas caeni]MCW3848692.1 DUF3857 domain-containing protein [Sphingomonas caeni]